MIRTFVLLLLSLSLSFQVFPLASQGVEAGSDSPTWEVSGGHKVWIENRSSAISLENKNSFAPLLFVFERQISSRKEISRFLSAENLRDLESFSLLSFSPRAPPFFA